MKNFEFKIENNIAIIIWDSPDKSMNVIDESVFIELEKLVGDIEANEKINGVVFTSAKKHFGGGADLALIDSLIDNYNKTKNANLLMQQAGRLSALLRKIELMPKVWVAALNGMAMGGCLELALACNVRISVADENIKFALPEVKLGLLPGGGGTQRLIRLINPQDAMQMLLQGKSINAKKAHKLGLVAELVANKNLIVRAKEIVSAGGETKAAWDIEKFKPPLRLWSAAGMQMVSAANALVRKETYGNYPAAKNIMRCVYEGLQLPFDLALKVEVRYFVNCLMSLEAKAMIRTLFYTMQKLNKGASRPQAEQQALNCVAVLGAGFMGCGIANVSAQAGLRVLLLDSNLEQAEKGKAIIEESLAKLVAKNRLTEKNKTEILALIEPQENYDCLQNADLVIEAVFEDSTVKEQVIKQARKNMGADKIFASNTSTIPITELAKFDDGGENFIGLHFFSPVERMRLVEIIKGKQTSAAAVALAMDYVMRIKKTGILVNDCRGFYVNRCVIRYLNEAWSLVVEGVPVVLIDNLARSLGFPLGPLQLNDEVAIDLSQKIIKQTLADCGENAVKKQHIELIDWLVANGRLGKKSGKGFYEYENGKRRPWAGFAERYTPQECSHQDIKDRLLYTIILEAARVVEEGVCDVESADLGAILGFGFPPWSGGPLSCVERIGAIEFVARAEVLAKKYGSHFDVPAMLQKMANGGSSFYG